MLSAYGPSTIVAILVGVGLAIAAFVPVVALRYRRAGRLTALDLVMLLAVAVYAMALWTYTLVPLPETDTFACVTANTHPFRFLVDIRRAGGPLTTNWPFFQVAFNVVLFLPLGFFLTVLARRGVVVATAIGAAVSSLIEFTQLTGLWGIYPCAYRMFDVDDIIVNTLGALVGALVGLPVAWLLARSRPAPRASAVTFGRRLVGLLADATVVGLLGYGTAVAVRAVRLYVLGTPVAQLSGPWDQLAIVILPALVEGVFVLTRGRTVGEAVVQLHAVPRAGSSALAARVLKYVCGVGGGLLLYSALVPSGWPLVLYAVVTLVAALLTQGHRGLSHLVARMDLCLDPPPEGAGGTDAVTVGAATTRGGKHGRLRRSPGGWRASTPWRSSASRATTTSSTRGWPCRP